MKPQPETLGEISYRTVRLADLTTDGRFNRPVSDQAVDRIAQSFNPKAWGALALWEHDGKLVILDGQHRVEAARRFGIPEEAKCLPAVVHRGLTLDRAAELFVQLNATKLVRAYEKFHALRTSGHLETLEIDRIVRAQGLVVHRNRNDGAIAAVSALQTIYRLGEPQGALLAMTLRTLHKAWGPLQQAYDAALLRGLALYFHDHRDTPPDALASAITHGPGAPINLLAWAKTIAGTQRMPLDQAIAEVLATRVIKRVKVGVKPA